MPRVSVIIPVYNRRDLISRAVTSVMRQSFTDFDLIVVDDGSTDGTADLDLWNRHPAVRYLRLAHNSGVSAARNAGVGATESKWIAFLDSDDEWLSEKLSRQMQWLDNNQQYEIMQCCETWIRNGKRVNPPLTHRKTGGDIFAASLERCMITPSTVVMRRSLFMRTGGFNEAFPACEDYDLWLRICATSTVGLLDEELALRYGGHSDQLSSTVPRLDQYRITSLQNLLAAGVLTAQQRVQTLLVLSRKAEYMAQGCRKSGNQPQQKYYETIAQAAREEL